MSTTIYMDPSVTNRGVPNVMGEKLVKPTFKKKPKFESKKPDNIYWTIGNMFDDDYLSLLAVNMYKKYPLDTKVKVAKFIHDGERVCIAKFGDVEYTSVGDKIFIEKNKGE